MTLGAFAKDKDIGEKENKDAPAEIVYGMAGGTGICTNTEPTESRPEFFNHIVANLRQVVCAA